MSFKNRFFISIISGIASFFLLTSPTFAHVIVYPHQVGIAVTQDFTVSVPNEKDNPVISVKLLIPKEVSLVLPDATQGWTITTKSTGKGDNAAVTEIDWTDGSIPVGQREEFIFQAQAPANPTTIAWKAYQTYSDGTVVSWDIDPAMLQKLSDAQQDKLADKENKGEYSTTQVINDLAASNAMTVSQNATIQNAKTSELLSWFAVLFSISALYISLRKKNK